MQTYTTPRQLIDDYRSSQHCRRNSAHDYMRKHGAEFKSFNAQGTGVSAAFTFSGVRYVVVHGHTKSGDVSKRYRVEPLDAFIEEKAAWYTSSGLDAAEAVKEYTARYAA